MNDVIFEVRDGEGRITLNRPRSINALTIGMLADIGEKLSDWLDDDRVERVRLTGAGERGLCSGADVRALRAELAGRGESAAQLFFTVEYAVDALIATYAKPVRADLFGITMGGGLGLAGHCADRVVRADSRLAMPETIIGLFPDVGMLYELSRAPGELGTHLTLTGGGVGAADAIALGLADRAEGEIGPAELTPQRAWIDECYAGDDAERMLAALLAHPDPAARAAGQALAGMAPTSVKVTLRAIRAARSMTLAQVLDQDLRLARHFLARPDLPEGIRAQVVDKDRTPLWQPAELAAVTAADVDTFFA